MVILIVQCNFLLYTTDQGLLVFVCFKVAARSVCFWREPGPVNWAGAVTGCTQLGGSLAKIIRSSENDEISSIRYITISIFNLIRL